MRGRGHSFWGLVVMIKLRLGETVPDDDVDEDFVATYVYVCAEVLRIVVAKQYTYLTCNLSQGNK